MGTKQARNAIHEELQKIKTKNGGMLRVDDVIEAAKRPGSPLHSEFTWDVKSAALKLWRMEARQLIASFEITYTINKTEFNVQEFVETPRKAEKEQGYVSIEDVKSNKQLAREFMARELAIASTYVSRAEQYAAILGVTGQVQTVIKKLKALQVAVGAK